MGGWTQLGEGRAEWQEVRTHKEQHREDRGGQETRMKTT